jgi:hypothetical protein
LMNETPAALLADYRQPARDPDVRTQRRPLISRLRSFRSHAAAVADES